MGETYQLGFYESLIFKKIMENALNVQDILDEMAKFTKANNDCPNKIVGRMRNALQQYFKKVQGYMVYIGCTDKLTYDDYNRILNFLKSMMDIDEKSAKFFASSFEKVLDEELFPVLKCTDEYQRLMEDLVNVQANIQGFGSTANVMDFLGNNLMGFASRSQMLYKANPLSVNYDNEDSTLNELAQRFYNKCLAEAKEGDVFSELIRKNAFDDFIKEETLKDNKAPKLKLTKESK